MHAGNLHHMSSVAADRLVALRERGLIPQIDRDMVRAAVAGCGVAYLVTSGDNLSELELQQLEAAILRKTGVASQ